MIESNIVFVQDGAAPANYDLVDFSIGMVKADGRTRRGLVSIPS